MSRRSGCFFPGVGALGEDSGAGEIFRAQDVHTPIPQYAVAGIFLSPSRSCSVRVEGLGMDVSGWELRSSRSSDQPQIAPDCLVFGVVIYVFKPVPRREACGTPCQTCRHRCEYQAIEPTGKIDYAECFQCLDCVSIYQDDEKCFPLIQMRKSGDGFVPVKAS